MAVGRPIPNGEGAAQQTTAAQMVLRGAVGTVRRAAPSRRRRARAASASPPRRKRARAASGRRPSRLVKGSAAAKRYMASIRRKRRR